MKKAKSNEGHFNSSNKLTCVTFKSWVLLIQINFSDFPYEDKG